MHGGNSWPAIFRGCPASSWAAPRSTRTSIAGRLAAVCSAMSSERGFLIRQDHYNGVNLAYLLEVRASLGSGDDRITDCVLADRVRRRVIDVTRAELARIAEASKQGELTQPLSQQLRDEVYWCEASRAEALAGLGDPAADEELKKATSHAALDWMREITLAQVAKVKSLRARREQKP